MRTTDWALHKFVKAKPMIISLQDKVVVRAFNHMYRCTVFCSLTCKYQSDAHVNA